MKKWIFTLLLIGTFSAQADDLAFGAEKDFVARIKNVRTGDRVFYTNSTTLGQAQTNNPDFPYMATPGASPGEIKAAQVQSIRLDISDMKFAPVPQEFLANADIVATATDGQKISIAHNAYHAKPYMLLFELQSGESVDLTIFQADHNHPWSSVADVYGPAQKISKGDSVICDHQWLSQVERIFLTGDSYASTYHSAYLFLVQNRIGDQISRRVYANCVPASSSVVAFVKNHKIQVGQRVRYYRQYGLIARNTLEAETGVVVGQKTNLSVELEVEKTIQLPNNTHLNIPFTKKVVTVPLELVEL